MSGEAPPAAPEATSPNEAAVGAALDGLRSFRHNIWAPVLLGAIMLFDSWDSIAIAFAMPTLSADWHLNPLTMGFIISAGYGGQFLGAASLGAVAERIGRLPTFSAAVVIMCALALGCAFAGDYRTLLVLRFLQGLVIGGALPIAIAYVNELAPARTRGRYFGLFQTIAISGFAVASISSPFVIPHLGWRGMLGLGAIPIVLLPLVWVTLPESPRWLVRTGRLARANRALVKLGAPPVAFVEEQLSSGPTGDAPRRTSFLTLLSPEFRVRTMIVTLLWFLTMFPSFGLTTWVPSIYVKVFHIAVPRALTYSATASFSILVVLAFSGMLIDRFGRRPLALGGLLGTAVALLILSFCPPSQELALVGIVILGQIAIFFGAFTLWPYTAEIFPTHVRALALGYGSSVGRGASMLTPLFVGFILNRGAPIKIVFVSFGLFALGAFLVWLLKTSETNGRPLETI